MTNDSSYSKIVYRNQQISINQANRYKQTARNVDIHKYSMYDFAIIE